ncbi:hypothetical protein SAMN05892877_12361 [Rhizobium subbaraonis]|uniref:Uncharacterized protein n=1 Tax=Rhizobium subbaraonis TaxID=908946 RepID=A0A285UXL5_9HYPH|nr:hypothetical protein [Rhizobium subbaraonis]SOC46624.1 hypothetical protein SAMN05892877_12361 [Rhizobium subbaraonis]
MNSEEQLQRIGEVLTTALQHKREMIAASERQRIAECPRCGGSLRFALVGPKNHLRMFCRGNPTDPENMPHCGMSLIE